MRIFATARIAVVDADADRLASLCKALSALGLLHLIPVSSEDDARDLTAVGTVDLCVLNAAGLTRADDLVPQNPFDPARTPGILIAANPTRTILKEAKASGFRLVIPAPVVPRILYRRIGSVLQKVRRASRVQTSERSTIPCEIAGELP
jgi:hypothetical protein